MMKVYTKRGDQGQTDLFGGARVSKANQRVVAYGQVDAANSAIGFVACAPVLPPKIACELQAIMSDLFDIGAELATAAADSAKKKLTQHLDSAIHDKRIGELEALIDAASEQLPELKTFVLPTGSEASARLHLARTAVRMAEQQVVLLQDQNEHVRPQVLMYLNRLSDLLFVWARFANSHSGAPEVLWMTRKAK